MISAVSFLSNSLFLVIYIPIKEEWFDITNFPMGIQLKWFKENDFICVAVDETTFVILIHRTYQNLHTLFKIT